MAVNCRTAELTGPSPCSYITDEEGGSCLLGGRPTRLRVLCTPVCLHGRAKDQTPERRALAGKHLLIEELSYTVTTEAKLTSSLTHPQPLF
jgi:hypothetical protein